MKALFLFLLAMPAIGVTGATAQQRGMSENVRQVGELRTRLSDTEARIATGERRGAITRARANALRRQVRETRQSMVTLGRQQGFVSAAEFASYHRTLAAIDAELDGKGVGRSYGNDALPSAEVIAFQRADARLRYREARIEHDASGCAVYLGKARDGRIRRERLLSAAGRPICTAR